MLLPRDLDTLESCIQDCLKHAGISIRRPHHHADGRMDDSPNAVFLLSAVALLARNVGSGTVASGNKQAAWKRRERQLVMHGDDG